MADDPWEAQQRRAFTMAFVVSLRKAHDASSTTVSWPDPQAYITHFKRKTHSAHQGHQLPDVGKGSGLDHATFDRPLDNQVHRHPRVGDSSSTGDSSQPRPPAPWS